jgi:hypothetical protein
MGESGKNIVLGWTSGMFSFMDFVNIKITGLIRRETNAVQFGLTGEQPRPGVLPTPQIHFGFHKYREARAELDGSSWQWQKAY